MAGARAAFPKLPQVPALGEVACVQVGQIGPVGFGRLLSNPRAGLLVGADVKREIFSHTALEILNLRPVDLSLPARTLVVKVEGPSREVDPCHREGVLSEPSPVWSPPGDGLTIAFDANSAT
jgi:hypothetical protein